MSRTYKEHHPTAHNPKNRIPTPYLDKEGKDGEVKSISKNTEK